MEKIAFARPLREVSCIVGNLFSGLEPPCKDVVDNFFVMRTTDGLVSRHHVSNEIGCSAMVVVVGWTHSNSFAKVEIKGDRCTFYGVPSDLEAVLSGVCPGKECCRGRR